MLRGPISAFLLLPGMLAIFLGTTINAFGVKIATTKTQLHVAHSSSLIPDWDGELTDEDEEMIRQIRGPAGLAIPRQLPKAIYILSDTTGVTARLAVEKSLAQFNGCDDRYVGFLHEENNDDDEDCENLTSRMFPFVRQEKEVASIIREAAQRSNTIFVFTFADQALRESTCRMLELAGIQYVDLLGPMLNELSGFLERKPIGWKRSSKRRTLSDDYYRRIEAVEFTLKCDDGMSPHLMPQADVILIGVSRTGKTPLSVYLAQTLGLKVSNVPLVVDLPPPSQLFGPEVNPKRVFCLTLNVGDLQRIRKSRIERELKASRHESKYAQRSYLTKDVRNAQRIALEQGFTEIDVTGRAVEETASLVSGMLNERF